MSEKPCLDCDGSGVYTDGLSTCPFCEGLGTMDQPQRDSYLKWVYSMKPTTREEHEQRKASTALHPHQE